MWKVMLVTFVGLGWGFYELSGGGDFEAPAPKARISAKLTTYEAPTSVASVQVISQQAATQVNAVTDAAGQALSSGSVISLTALNQSATSATASGVAMIAASSVRPNARTEGANGSTETFAPEVVSLNVEENTKDIRSVSGNRVNMRNGPSTNFDILDRLVKGDEVEVLQIPGDGWVKLRVASTGQIGWMAERLLTPPTN